MARHRRRHHRRRRYGDPVISMPSFGRMSDLNPLGKHVNSTDVLVGAGIGLAGGGLVMYGVRRFWPSPPSFVTQYSGPLSAIAAGAVAYTLFQKKSKSRALGYFAGAVAIGAIPFVYSMVKSALPASVTQYFGDPVIAMPSYGGLLTRSPGPLAGLLTASPGPAPAAYSPARRAMGF
jgi:hypothetical protein